MIKIWVDDVREMPNGYDYNMKSVYGLMYALTRLTVFANDTNTILIDLDHDAGECVRDGGDYIKILEWLEWLKHVYVDWGTDFPLDLKFKIHSGNPVGRENMKRIIEANGWELID